MATNVKIHMVKCACPDCVSVLDISQGISREGRVFCSEECADHHKNGTGCGNAGCRCHG